MNAGELIRVRLDVSVTLDAAVWSRVFHTTPNPTIVRDDVRNYLLASLRELPGFAETSAVVVVTRTRTPSVRPRTSRPRSLGGEPA